MAHASAKKPQFLTIPNLLSLFRLTLIPLFCWLYLKKAAYLWSAAVLVLSGITDVADGYIARHFHMTSDVGKILDPIADKLTQAAMLLCLVSRFPHMLYVFLLMAVKEIVTSISGLLYIRKTGKVYSSVWHGKLTTVLLYSTLLLHLLWFNIPVVWSDLTIAVCSLCMILSCILYVSANIKAILSK